MSQSPYIDDLKKTLETTIEMRDRLKLRISMLTDMCSDMEKYNAYEINEFRITMIKSQGEVDAIQKVINEKTSYFEQYAKEYELDRQETIKNYDRIVEIAKRNAEKIPAVHHSLSSVKWDVQKESEEARVFFYKRLKGILEKANAL